MARTGYPVLRKRKSGPPSDLDDPAIQAQLLALASTGMSRRGVAARAGFPHSTLHGWLERGRANPNERPYGPFATAYLKAERGIEHAASEAEARRVQSILERQSTPGVACPECGALAEPDIKELEWVSRLKERRFPEDHGTSAHHRRPELDPSGEAWHEREGLNHAQLVHMLSAPPEPVAKALVAAADQVYELLLASGWQPKETT